MKKLHYSNLKSRRDSYYSYFKPVLNTIQQEWTNLKQREPWIQEFRFKATDIILGNEEILVKVYLRYKKLYDIWKVGKTNDERAALKKSIEYVFDYKKYRSHIVDYFTDAGNGIDLSTCYYCEMAYINTYSFRGASKNHFDLDHILDKGSCPLLGLSMLNLVPACQCCNEKIKRSNVFGDGNAAIMQKLMPTSRSFDFDSMVYITMALKQMPSRKGYVNNKECYQIKFNPNDSDYADYIKKLHLCERYEFHKVEALRLLDLKENYPDSTISKIAKLLGRTPREVHEDIFAEGFNDSTNRCFSKLRRDIMADRTI